MDGMPSPFETPFLMSDDVTGQVTRWSTALGFSKLVPPLNFLQLL